MDATTVEERLLDMLADICEDDVVREERDINLFDAGLLDSMTMLEVLVDIEDSFGITIAPTEIEREDMDTVNKIIGQVSVRLG